MKGAGKYDKECTRVRVRTKAMAVVVWVHKGNHGSGFSVQAPLDMIFTLPEMLRATADQIEADNRAALTPAGRPQ